MTRDSNFPDKNQNNDHEKIILPVIEEQLRVDKKVVEKDSVRIIKKVHEEEVPVTTPYFSEEVNVEHIPVNKYVDERALPQIRMEGDKTIIPVLKEVVVVEKKIILVEELHVTKHQIQHTSTENITLRKEEIVIEGLHK